MLQSELFYKTRKEIPADADSINASFLTRSGFIEKQMAGVYALLPLGFRVYRKIEAIVREELDAIGGQELLLNVLQPRELWEETGRWQSAIDIFYKLKDSRGKDLLLAPTHEEQITDIFRRTAKSYKNLPVALYQIQTKFRNEPRAKSGLLRGREFVMKDMYSFHESEADLWRYYEIVKTAYFKIFRRLGLDAKYVEASGGVFSKYSHEFQVLTPVGEDTIYYCENCDFAQNKEIAKMKEGERCSKCGGKIKKEQGIEVGNIFPLKTRFSDPMKAVVPGKDGRETAVLMGCYGIGLTRALATVVEVKYNGAENKMIWPEEIAPYAVHLLSLKQNEKAHTLYDDLIKNHTEVLFDDRELSAGEKFAEADLIGCPLRIIISEKSLEAGGAEVVFQSKKQVLSFQKALEMTKGA